MVNSPTQVALIQGATGGLGQALTQELLSSNQFKQVIVTSRNSQQIQSNDNRLTKIDLDLSSDMQIIQAAQKVRSICEELHIVITTAGLLSDENQGLKPEKKLLDLNRLHLQSLFEVNCIGPFLWYQALFPLFRHRSSLKIATLSARVGSISDNRLGGWYGYRASKAAQNMMTKTFALELKRINPSSLVVGLHPGTVDTKLTRPFQNVSQKQRFTPEYSAHLLWKVLQNLDPVHTGRCFAWDGQEIPP